MRFSGLAPFTLLLASLRDLQDIPSSDCLRQSYYGIYGFRRAFIVDRACLQSSVSLISFGTTVRLREEEQNLVWIHRESVEPSPTFDTDLDHLLREVRTPQERHTRSFEDVSQVTLSSPVDIVSVLHRAHDGALLSISDTGLQALSTTLPASWRCAVFPASPRPLVPVPPHARERLKDALEAIRFDHVVASIVNGISVHRLRSDVRYLAGEDPASDWLTRHSFAADTPRAAAWLKTQFEKLGATCELRHFQEGFAPNVVCRYVGSQKTTETIVLGAHYDDRGSFGSVRAPGANDDASGTAALLGIAHAIARRGVAFKANVLLCAFAGEEQGMVGSAAYAQELREQGANITMMIQGDTIAYRAPGEPLQMGLSNPRLIGVPELTQILENVSAIYSPELTVGYFPYPGGSDHQSFHEQGFPAVQVYERAGPNVDPMRHNSGDLSAREGFDFEQIKAIAKVELATVLHVAGFDLEQRDDPV